MNRAVLAYRLRQAFDGDEGEFRAVVRMAGDLGDAGQYRDHTGHALSPTTVVEHLRDAPPGSVAHKWNWWMGALEFAYGGYADFQVWAWADSGGSLG